MVVSQCGWEHLPLTRAVSSYYVEDVRGSSCGDNDQAGVE